MPADTSVLIVGAGPTGLTLAIDLARCGIAAVVVEQAADLPRQSRGKGLQPRTLEVFHDLGVINEILSYGEHRQQLTLYKDRRRLAVLPAGTATPRPDLPYPAIVMIPQWRTTSVLLQRLRELGGDVRFGHRLEDVTASDDGVRAQVSDEHGTRHEIRADYLVGSDGGRSTVRRLAGIPFDGVTRASHRYLLGDVRVEGWEHSDGPFVRSYAWMGSDGAYLGLGGLPSTAHWQIGMNVPADSSLEPSLETFQRLWDERTGRTDVKLRDASWLSDFQVNVRLVDSYRKGRLFLAGDAAHVHPPTGGLGMNTGIQDAYNLGWKLALCVRGKADDSLLDTYQAERLPIARGVLAKSTDILDVMMSKNPLVSTLVQRVLLPALSIPSVNRALLGRVSQIDVGYRDSPLTADELAGGRLRAGDRAPDAPAIDPATGRSTRLFDIFRGPHFTLLLFGAEAARGLPEDLPAEIQPWLVVDDQPPVGWTGGTVRDSDRSIRRAYRAAPGTALLVRPDGYLGWRSRVPDPRAYLTGQLGWDSNSLTIGRVAGPS